RDAFSRIGDDNTAVLGPAKDGGFYLIGLARQCRDPFRFEEWGSAVVFSRTRQALAACGFRIATVAVRSDIDLSEDLPLLRTDPLMGKSLSVIVPTLAGPEKLSSFLESLRDRLWPGDEIVLVEAGTSPNLSLRRLSKVVLHARAPRGRGIQQNIGAMIAKGDLLFFLHDDTVPPPEFPYLIRRACRQGASALGCFRLAFHPSNRLLELVAAWANLRSFLFKLPYGDQGFFCGRELFERVGGFRHKYLMEDVDFVKQCRRIGRLNMLDARVLSSSVRYLNKGILNASLQNHAIMILYLLGVCEKELYTIYYRSKSRPL
ncbi:MAG: TIGR04283 family arsenosugar biosynthesis glycosyltransferase, partial [Syntrophobacteraceae bacterium]